VRVLLVEDDEGIRSIVAELLAERGHQVIEHTHAARAWAAVEREPFPLAIVDWMLPGEMDGLELCRRIRGSAASARTAILVTTARTGGRDLAQLLEAGADDYLAKPFDLSALETRLAIAERYAQRRAEEAEAVHEAERRAAMLAQAEKLGALGQMASGLAHDLNQALGIIAGYSELAQRELRREQPDVASLQESLSLIGQAAVEGGQRIAQLLTFARRQEEEGEAVPIPLSAILSEVAQLTAPRWRDAAQAEGRPIRVIVRTEGDVRVRGWRPVLRQALTNLVLNAVDALPNGGTIELVARYEAHAAVVEVVDSGTGMTPEVRARAFEPFFTTKGELGTGLGLAQVRAAVEQHGGAIELESEPGRGTTFRMRMPPEFRMRTPPEAPDQAVAEAPAAEPGRPQRVLVVDDEPRLSHMASLMLRQQGHQVATAASGEEALARLRAEWFDVLVTDLGLGTGMNGWELARQVRSRWPGTRIVLATGWAASIDDEQARATGVRAVVAKPYRISDLRRAIG
jgi:signal transduction histidine kinase